MLKSPTPSPLRFAAAFAAALLLLSGAASPARADVTVEQCQAEWADSAAADSCSNEEVVVAVVKGNDYCKINADCATDGGGTRNDVYMAPLDRISELINCNGLLKIEYCASN